MNDLQIAVSALSAKKPVCDLLYRYYDGQQPLVYSSEKLREIFSNLAASFTANWCAVVVDSVLDRLALRGFSVSDNDAAAAALDALREQSGLVDDEDAIHEDVCVTGEAFVMAEMDAAGFIQVFRNDPRLCHAEYESDNPRRLRYAAKWWQSDGGVRLNLYYPDRTEYYVAARAFANGEPPTAQAFEPWGDEPVMPNAWGVIPVFHFRTSRRSTKSQLDGVIELQNAINKLLADMMVAAEFAAYRQRFVISQAGVTGLKNVPFGIWDIPGGDGTGQPTSVGEFSHTPLSNYLEALNKLASDIGTITRTPRHYFFAQGGDPSGEALIAMEAPLNRKVARLQTALAPTWRDLGAFLLLLAGAPVPSQSIWINYEPPQTVQPMTDAAIIKTLVEAGMPLATVLRDRGWAAADLQEMADDERAARVNQATYADAVLSAAQTQFDRGEAV